jgi:hypothetical protein
MAEERLELIELHFQVLGNEGRAYELIQEHVTLLGIEEDRKHSARKPVIPEFQRIELSDTEKACVQKFVSIVSCCASSEMKSCSSLFFSK